MFYQQGDVLIKKVSDEQQEKWIRERDARKVKSLTLAKGETTGHAHVLSGKNIIHFIPKNADYIAFELTEDATISHEEHKPFVLPAGLYFVEIVKEYDHFNEETRRVYD
jgi:hypothetical protein